MLRTPRNLFQRRVLTHLQYVVLLLLDSPNIAVDPLQPHPPLFVPSTETTTEGTAFEPVCTPEIERLQAFIPDEFPEVYWFRTKQDIAMNLVGCFLPGEDVLVLGNKNASKLTCMSMD